MAHECIGLVNGKRYELLEEPPEERGALTRPSGPPMPSLDPKFAGKLPQLPGSTGFAALAKAQKKDAKKEKKAMKKEKKAVKKEMKKEKKAAKKAKKNEEPDALEMLMKQSKKDSP